MHKQFLLEALKQAQLGRGICAPNPSVGAIAVQYGKIIARAWHQGAGTPHAEVLLLKALPENCPDVTIYVTLEPCNHWGRTPPCVDAIIKSGIKHIVYAYSDPNPLVQSNHTPAILQQHGISALHYPVSEINDFYQSYWHWTRTGKPFVTAKIAQTFDGKIGRHNERVMLSNALCSEFTHEQRLHTDVILTTARTIHIDNPLLNSRLVDKTVSKPIAILDSQLTLNLEAQVFHHATHCHIYHVACAPKTSSHHCSYYLMPSIDNHLDLNAVINHLGQLGYHDVWVEAGSTLFNALHNAGLINRTYVYLVPSVLGKMAISAWNNTTLFNRPFSIQWHPKGDNMIAQLDWSFESMSK